LSLAAADEIRVGASVDRGAPGVTGADVRVARRAMSGDHGTVTFCIVDAGVCVLSPAYWAWTVQAPAARGGPDMGTASESLKVPSEAVVSVSTVAEPVGGW